MFGYEEKPIKIMQYADDCILFLNDKNELCTAISLLRDFQHVSGLELNLSKCEGLWLGRDKYKQEKCTLFGIKWPKQIRCLGIYIGHSEETNVQQNWTNKLEKVEQILESWNTRKLSLFGKVQIIKTFAISQFVLPATLLKVPEGIVKQIESLLYRFLWGTRDKVKRVHVIQDVKNGGLSMVDIKSLFESFKAGWIKRLESSDPVIHSWSQLAMFNFHALGQCDTNLYYNFDDNVVFNEVNSLSSFYKDVFCCFNKVFVSTLDEFKENIVNQCIWGNKFITFRQGNKKCVLFLRNWIRSGVNKISDLKFIDGKLNENYIYQKIGFSGNILREVFLLKNALLPFQNELRHISKDSCNVAQKRLGIYRSRDMYLLLRSKVTSNILSVTKYLRRYCDIDDVNYIYIEKVWLEKEIKLKEFNFKVLHGILPCNKNLKQWKIRICDSCDVCGEVQTIEHLLWDCRYVRSLWKIVESVLDMRLNFDMILGINNSCKESYVLTLVSFLVYKEWLLLSLENKLRNNRIVLEYYKQELLLRLKIYERSGIYSYTELYVIERLIDKL